MNQKQPYLQSIKIIFLGLVIALGTSYVFAAFTAPKSAPPNCNTGDPGCDAPINVSKNSQSKLGQLLINTNVPSNPNDPNDPNNPNAVGLKVFGKSIFENIQITGEVVGGVVVNPPGFNKVLTSDQYGKGAWQSLAAVSSVCNTINTIAGNTRYQLPLTISGENICSDDEGCTIRVARFNSNGVPDLINDSPHLYIQTSTGKWADRDGATGINGDSIETDIWHGFGDKTDWKISDDADYFNDYNYSEKSPDYFTFRDLSGSPDTYYKASVCDF